MIKVFSTRQWEKDQMIEAVAEVIDRFSQSASDQINLSSSSAQKALAFSIVEVLDEEGHLR